jgi:hypothetical protein
MNYFSKAPQGQNGWQNYLKTNGLQPEEKKEPEEKKGFNPSVLEGDWDFTECKGDTIYSTYDYDRFHFNPSNRPVNQRHVKKLQESYEVKDLNTVIDVTVDGEITDGQHRYTMFEETGRAVIFRVVFEQTIADVQTLNLNSKRWSMEDYACYYISEEKRKVEKKLIAGPGPYTMLNEVSKTYNKSINELLNVLRPTDARFSLKSSGKTALTPPVAFRAGIFEMTVAEKEDLVVKVLSLQEIKTFYLQAFRKNFVRAYAQALGHPRFRHKKFLLRLSQGHKFYDKLSVPDYKKQIQDIYNYGLKHTNRIKIV